MKILYHHRTMGDGAEGVHIAEMVNAFSQLGHQVQVQSLIGERTNVENQRTQQLEWLRKPMPRAMYEMMEIGYNLVGYRTLLRVCQKFQPDVIYDRYMLYNHSAIWAAHRFGIPAILEVNAPLAYERALYETLCFPRIANAMERRTCNAADTVIAVSTPLKDYLVDQGVQESKIVVMPNGADMEKFRSTSHNVGIRNQLGVADRTVVGFVGILRDWHRLDLLFDAIAGIDWCRLDVHALIVGDGPAEEQLRSQVRELGLHDRVTFTGRVPHDAISDYIASMDIAVSPHATPYASPMKILEYMAMGKAVVAPDMPNIRDIITDGQDGVLFTPENAADLGRCLNWLIAQPEMRASVGQWARKTVESKRTWQHNAAQVVEIVKAAQR